MQLTPVSAICSLIFWLMLAGSLPARAEPRLYVQETKHFRIIYYSPQHEYLAPLLIRSFENALIFYKANFGYEPKGKITVLIQDFDDSGYGGAGTVPIDFIQIGIEPFNLVFETLPSAERMGLMSRHELMHIVMGDETAPRDATAGPSPPTAPLPMPTGRARVRRLRGRRLAPPTHKPTRRG